MSRKVWALTTGSYSDYQVQALFTSKKLAVAAAEAHKASNDYMWSEPSVEAFDLYDKVPEPVTVWAAQVTIWDSGKLTDERITASTDLPWNHYSGAPKRPHVRYVRAPIHKNLGGRLEVHGTDEQGVLQAFGDNKARILAEGAGVL